MYILFVEEKGCVIIKLSIAEQEQFTLKLNLYSTIKLCGH